MSDRPDIPDDALADLLDDGRVNGSTRPGAIGSVPAVPSRPPAIADGSAELPATMTPTQVVELKRLAGVEVAPGGVLDAVTGGKIRTVIRAATLALMSFLGTTQIVPGRVLGIVIAALAAAEIALYTLVKGASE